MFESQPASSAADVKAGHEEDQRLVGAFATSAKEKFLQKQKEASEGAATRATPGIVSKHVLIKHQPRSSAPLGLKADFVVPI